MTLCRAAVLAGLLALPASAQDYVATSGPLDDDAFYRLVACGAAPGGACAKPFLRWPVSRPVTVGFDRIDRAYLGGRQKRARSRTCPRALSPRALSPRALSRCG